MTAGALAYVAVRMAMSPAAPTAAEVVEAELTLESAEAGVVSLAEEGGIDANVMRGLAEEAFAEAEGKLLDSIPAPATPRTGPVSQLEVGPYQDLAARSVGGGLTPDHIPSFAAIRANVERQLGRPLTAAEARALREQTNTIVIRTQTHQQGSRTYGGRNTPAQIQTDSLDLQAAFRADQAALRQRLIQDGHTPEAVDAAFQQLDQLNRQAGRYQGPNMQNNLVSLLGMNLDAVARSAFVLSLNDQPATEKIEDRFYMELPVSGVALIASLEQRVMAVQLYAEGYQKYKGYAGAVPEGVSFSSPRRAVQDRLGKPSASGGGNVIQFFGKAPVWDRFDRSDYSLHVQYADDEASINLVTVMRPEFIPK
ncbi:MAG: hypothetical protein P4L84_30180 [Isosphaeraceae bacterium]|nr:hypothetical protein [Isosphaeraceae bacterium]